MEMEAWLAALTTSTAPVPVPRFAGPAEAALSDCEHRCSFGGGGRGGVVELRRLMPGRTSDSALKRYQGLRAWSLRFGPEYVCFKVLAPRFNTCYLQNHDVLKDCDQSLMYGTSAVTVSILPEFLKLG